MLNAEKVGGSDWLVRSGSGDVRFRPFVAIGEQRYSTYVNLA